jgi:hypothetical protein
MPNNIRLPSPPKDFTAQWGGQLVRALEQNLMATADANVNTVLAADTIGRVTSQVSLPFAGTFTYTPATMGLNVKIIMSGAQTITLDGTGLPVGARVAILFVQDGTGGRVLTWGGANLKWTAATAPTFNTTANRQNFVEFLFDGFFFNGIITAMNLF